MRVFITGATGFLGAHVVRELLRRGHTVRALVRPGRPHGSLPSLPVERVEGDLCDEASLHRACAGMEGMIHCAAHQSWWSRTNADQHAVNVDGSAALMRAAQAARVGRVVHVSSVAAVGASRRPALHDESMEWNFGRLGVHYASSKREGEERALAAARAGLPVVVVNPGAILGPRLDGRTGSLFARLREGRIRWAPQGGVSVTDVEDVTNGCINALDRGRVGERYILGGHNITWRELYASVARAHGRSDAFLPVPEVGRRLMISGAQVLEAVGLGSAGRSPEVYRVWGIYGWFDSGKARRELGYSVRPLVEIIRRTTGMPEPAVNGAASAG